MGTFLESFCVFTSLLTQRMVWVKRKHFLKGALRIVLMTQAQMGQAKQIGLLNTLEFLGIQVKGLGIGRLGIIRILEFCGSSSEQFLQFLISFR